MKRILVKILTILYFIALFLKIDFQDSSFAFYNGDDVKTESIFLVNRETQIPVFSKNAEEKRSMASLTKIMTYIIVCDKIKNLDINKIVVRPEALEPVDKESSVAGLRPNDELTILDLLHCLMICSGGDAAYVLADYVGNGDVGNFVNMMNEKALDLGCTNTHFVNPDGMYDENHYSTAGDMYIITKHAIDLPFFMEICNKTEYNVFNDDREPIKTTNKMLNPNEKDYYYPYAKGIKTGYHNQAGRCFVSCAEKNNVSYICVAMGAPVVDENGDRIEENIAMLDTKKLYMWAYENLSLKTVIKRNDPIEQVKLKYAWRKDKLLLSPETTVNMILPKNVGFSDLNIEFILPNSVEAPIEVGDLIGTARISYGEKFLNEINLVSSEDAPFSIIIFVTDTLKNIIFSKAFLALLIIVIVVAVIYLYMIFISNRHKKHKIKKRNFKNGL